MGLVREELAPLAGVYYVGGVGYCRRPVEALLEGVPNEGSWCGMVAASPGVDVLYQCLPLLDRDAALEDAGVAPLVELLVDDDEGFGTACNPSRLRLVRCERLADEVVEVWDSPVRRGVGLLCWVCVDLHDLRVR